MRPFPGLFGISAVAFACSCLPSLRAQASPPDSHWEFVNVVSGSLANPTPQDAVVWSQFVILPAGTPWLRLYYHAVHLDKGSSLRITSVLGGHTMVMRQEHMAQWSNSSCYFNGAAVLVELVAGANTTGNHLDIQQVLAGDINPPAAVPETICGATDNRVPSSDARAGRIDPIGCTGWIVDYPSGVDKVHMSAGHCQSGGQVLQFDVPASAANCSLFFPPPQKQFAIDNTTSAGVNGGLGNDYWVFRCFPNPTTGRTTFEEQGAAFPLATAMPALGSSVRIYGFGLDGTDVTGASGGNASCTCAGSGGTRNQTQQTHASSLTAITGNRVDHQIDTCGGNSGSPVLNNTTGDAIAIHTHGGCTGSGGSNGATSVLHPGLQSAMVAVAPAPVTNDDCANAIAVAVGSNGPYRNVGATSSAGAFSCGSNVVKDLWFRFTTCGGSHSFSTCTPTRTFDTVLQVFGGGCGSLVSLGCNDDAGGGCSLGSLVSLNLAAGTYFVRVGGANLSSGDFDLVVGAGEIYAGGPIVTNPTAGAGGAPASVVQTGPPYFQTELGFEASTGTNDTTVVDDFMTNGAWCVQAIEVFVYQTGATAPSITGVHLEIYDADPATFGVPVAGSPGLANNLFTTPGYLVSNTMAGIYRVLDTQLGDTSARVQSVLIGLPTTLTLNSQSVIGGRYYVRMQFTGSLAAGPAVVPITIDNLGITGDGTQSQAGQWVPLSNGGYGQGVPFKFYGGALSLPGAIENLGGGCSPATLAVLGAPHVGGALRMQMSGLDPNAVPMLVLGITDPNLTFAPLCGCVQHASLDVLLIGAAVDWQVPMVAAGLGFQVYAQGAQLLSPALACDIGLGFRFDLTNGFRIRFH